MSKDSREDVWLVVLVASVGGVVGGRGKGIWSQERPHFIVPGRCQLITKPVLSEPMASPLNPRTREYEYTPSYEEG